MSKKFFNLEFRIVFCFDAYYSIFVIRYYFEIRYSAFEIIFYDALALLGDTSPQSSSPACASSCGPLPFSPVR